MVRASKETSGNEKFMAYSQLVFQAMMHEVFPSKILIKLWSNSTKIIKIKNVMVMYRKNLCCWWKRYSNPWEICG